MCSNSRDVPCRVRQFSRLMIGKVSAIARPLQAIASMSCATAVLRIRKCC
jgi:hypothetical protein